MKNMGPKIQVLIHTTDINIHVENKTMLKPNLEKYHAPWEVNCTAAKNVFIVLLNDGKENIMPTQFEEVSCLVDASKDTCMKHMKTN